MSQGKDPGFCVLSFVAAPSLVPTCLCFPASSIRCCRYKWKKYVLRQGEAMKNQKSSLRAGKGKRQAISWRCVLSLSDCPQTHHVFRPDRGSRVFAFLPFFLLSSSTLVPDILNRGSSVFIGSRVFVLSLVAAPSHGAVFFLCLCLSSSTLILRPDRGSRVFAFLPFFLLSSSTLLIEDPASFPRLCFLSS